jgi:hypothetical protein
MAKKSKANSKKAVRKNAVPKKAAKKSASVKAVKKTTDNTIRIVLEVVIKDYFREARSGEMAGLEDMLGGADKPKIAYEFKGEKISVLNLTIHNKSVANPGPSGSVTLDYIPLSGEINVASMATGGAPDSSGNLQLKYQGRELFSPAEDFRFSGSIGHINTIAKIS